MNLPQLILIAMHRYLQHSILLQTVEQLAVSSCNKASMVTNAGDKDTQSSLQEWPHLDVPVAESLNKHLQVGVVHPADGCLQPT
jgi:hypothetical protein